MLILETANTSMCWEGGCQKDVVCSRHSEASKEREFYGRIGKGQAGLSANKAPGAPWNPTIGLSAGPLGDQEKKARR